MNRLMSAVTIGLLALTTGASTQNKKDTSSPDVTGKWVVSAETPHGKQPMALSLEQSGKDVTGTFGTLTGYISSADVRGARAHAPGAGRDRHLRGGVL